MNDYNNSDSGWGVPEPPQKQSNQNPDHLAKLSDLAENYLKQDRWSRRWTNLLKIAAIVYIVALLIMTTQQFGELSEAELIDSKPHAAIVKLEGTIMPGNDASAEKMIPLLQAAFKDPNAKGVIIQANSPGGSPVQSALINDEIFRLKKLYKKPVYAVVEDMCASGCYYIISAADKIYANKGSIVGSIGVRMDSFGFTGLMEKLGIENRSMTAGKHKTFINPFGPKDEAGREFFRKHVLERTHQQFINTVKKGRGDRLDNDPNLFTGLVWLGDEGIQKGLVDGLGDTGYVMRNVLKVNHSRTFETQKPLLKQLMGTMGETTASQLSLLLKTLN